MVYHNILIFLVVTTTGTPLHKFDYSLTAFFLFDLHLREDLWWYFGGYDWNWWFLVERGAFVPCFMDRGVLVSIYKTQSLSHVLDLRTLFWDHRQNWVYGKVHVYLPSRRSFDVPVHFEVFCQFMTSEAIQESLLFQVKFISNKYFNDIILAMLV